MLFAEGRQIRGEQRFLLELYGLLLSRLQGRLPDSGGSLVFPGMHNCYNSSYL